MAMDPKDTKLANGERQPTNYVRHRGNDWKGHERNFKHKQLARALANLVVKPVKA